MNDTYENYIFLVKSLINGNSDSYKKAIDDGLVIERKYNMNGEPYRYLTEDEWNEKYKPKN